MLPRNEALKTLKTRHCAETRHFLHANRALTESLLTSADTTTRPLTPKNSKQNADTGHLGKQHQNTEQQ